MNGNKKEDYSSFYKNLKTIHTNLISTLTCNSCHQVLENAITIKPCSHLFCHSCFKELSSGCPLCGKYKEFVELKSIDGVIGNVNELGVLVNECYKNNEANELIENELGVNHRKRKRNDVEDVEERIKELNGLIDGREKGIEMVNELIKDIEDNRYEDLNLENNPILKLVIDKQNYDILIKKKKRRFEKRMVICCTSLDEFQMHQVKKLIKLFTEERLILDIALSNEISQDVTHIITKTDKDNISKRTKKYCSGVLLGCWIVSFEWVKKCLQLKRKVNESFFEVKGDTCSYSVLKDSKFFRCAPALGRDNKNHGKKKLFHNFHFLKHENLLQYNNLVELVDTLVCFGGGKIITNLANEDKKKSKRITLVITDKEFNDKEKYFNTHGYHVVSYGWILDCISIFQIIDWKDY